MQVLIDFAAPQADGATTALRCAFDAPRQVLVAHTAQEVVPLLESVQALSRQGLWCVGYLRYEAAQAFDPALEVHEADGPLAWFGVFETPLPWPEGAPDAAAVAQWHAELTRQNFDLGMAEIHRCIAAGEFYQMNYTAPLTGTLQGKPRDLFTAMHRAQPGGYGAFIDTGDEQVLSVSPELFFDWDGERILVRPMKGTAPRGATPEEDAERAAQLRASAKECAENVMIVDLIRNDVSRIAQPFSVKVPHLFRLEPLPSVWQMTSDVQALTKPGTSLADVFQALFPCGSITGAPKVRAMQTICRLEGEPRGVYCGAIGVVRPGGAATFNVAIRTVTIKGEAARCGIGSGITADATAEGEWHEWRHKRAFLTRASQPFELLETLALQDGTFRHLSRHLSRMATAADHFGYVWNQTQVEACLQNLAIAHPSGLWRVRLLLESQGQVVAQAYAMAESPSCVQLALATSEMEEFDSEFVRFKTTRRAHYDAFAPTLQGVFDTLLWNPQGEVTECTRGNIAVQLDGRWVTPPLTCGLLGGVGRAHYLSEGRLVEAVVRVEDLARAGGLAFINSLRGWTVAELI